MAEDPGFSMMNVEFKQARRMANRPVLTIGKPFWGMMGDECH